MTLLKRSIMTLYSGALDIYSHQVRIVLAEKGVSVDVLNVDDNHPCEDLLELNPYNTLPTLVDRDLVLYQAQVIMEYLDERFPHPPLLPVYPVARAKNRLMSYRIERDWYRLVKQLHDDNQATVDAAREELRSGLIALQPVFADMPYFLSEEFTLVDCVIAPLLWRLPLYGIEIPNSVKAIHKYQERVFNRDSFQASLTEAEREIREPHAIL
ncbi:MAG: stringent starvation protein A [Gammaproteobacteria bacterium]|nr:stringent starvation protein A [Gammaproteobacteria bacterium]MCH9744377.1 stringent starvation protein A [Gammaproteobacteria bacterium]